MSQMPPSQADQWWLDAQRVDKLATLDPRLSSMRTSRDRRRRSRPHSAILAARPTGRPAGTALTYRSHTNSWRDRNNRNGLRHNHSNSSSEAIESLTKKETKDSHVGSSEEADDEGGDSSSSHTNLLVAPRHDSRFDQNLNAVEGYFLDRLEPLARPPQRQGFSIPSPVSAAKDMHTATEDASYKQHIRPTRVLGAMTRSPIHLSDAEFSNGYHYQAHSRSHAATRYDPECHGEGDSSSQGANMDPHHVFPDHALLLRRLQKELDTQNHTDTTLQSAPCIPDVPPNESGIMIDRTQDDHNNVADIPTSQSFAEPYSQDDNHHRTPDPQLTQSTDPPTVGDQLYQQSTEGSLIMTESQSRESPVRLEHIIHSGHTPRQSTESEVTPEKLNESSPLAPQLLEHDHQFSVDSNSSRGRSRRGIGREPGNVVTRGVSVWLEEAQRRYTQTMALVTEATSHTRGENTQHVEQVIDENTLLWASSSGYLSSHSSMDAEDLADLELTHRAIQIRSEIRTSELQELALEAERAAEAGEEKFAGRASTFGRSEGSSRRQDGIKKTKRRRRKTMGNSIASDTGMDESASDSSTMLPSTPPLLSLAHRVTSAPGRVQLMRTPRLNSRRSLASIGPMLLTTPSKPKKQIKVLALRHINEVMPVFADLHQHLRSHMARNKVDQFILVTNIADNKDPADMNELVSPPNSAADCDGTSEHASDLETFRNMAVAGLKNFVNVTARSAAASTVSCPMSDIQTQIETELSEAHFEDLLKTNSIDNGEKLENEVSRDDNEWESLAILAEQIATPTVLKHRRRKSLCDIEIPPGLCLPDPVPMLHDVSRPFSDSGVVTPYRSNASVRKLTSWSATPVTPLRLSTPSTNVLDLAASSSWSPQLFMTPERTSRKSVSTNPGQTQESRTVLMVPPKRSDNAFDVFVHGEELEDQQAIPPVSDEICASNCNISESAMANCEINLNPGVGDDAGDDSTDLGKTKASQKIMFTPKRLANIRGGLKESNERAAEAIDFDPSRIHMPSLDDSKPELSAESKPRTYSPLLKNDKFSFIPRNEFTASWTRYKAKKEFQAEGTVDDIGIVSTRRLRNKPPDIETLQESYHSGSQSRSVMQENSSPRITLDERRIASSSSLLDVTDDEISVGEGSGNESPESPRTAERTVEKDNIFTSNVLGNKDDHSSSKKVVEQGRADVSDNDAGKQKNRSISRSPSLPSNYIDHTHSCVTEDESHRVGVSAPSAQTCSHSCQSSGKHAANDELVQVDKPTANGISTQTLTADPFHSTNEISQMTSELTYPSESFLNDVSQQRQHCPEAQNDENSYSPNIDNSGNGQSVLPNLSQMEISEKESVVESKKCRSAKPLAEAKDVDALKPSLPRSRSFDKSIFDKRLTIGFRPSRKNLTLELVDDKQSISSSLSVKSFPPMQSRFPTGVEKLPLLPLLPQSRDSQNQVAANDETLVADVPLYLAHNKESGCNETDDNPLKRLRYLPLSRGLGSQSGSPITCEALASVPTVSCRSSGNQRLSQNHSVNETPSSNESESSVECQISERLARLTTNTAKFQTGTGGKGSDLGKVTEDDLRRLRHKLYSISGDAASFERHEANTQQACDKNDPAVPSMDNLTVTVEGQNPTECSAKSPASSEANSYGPFKSAMDPVARFFKHLSPRRKEYDPTPPASFFDPNDVEDIAFVSNYLYYTRPHTKKSKKSVGSTNNIEHEDNLFRSIFNSDGQPCLQNFVGCSNFSSAVDKFLPRNAPQKSPTFAASLSGKEQEMSNWFEATFHQFSTAKASKSKEVNGCVFQPPHLKAKGALLAKGTTSTTSTLPSPLFFAQIPGWESPPQTPHTPMQQEEALNSLLPTPVSPDRALKKEESQGFRFDHEQSVDEDYFASDQKLENKKENHGRQPSNT